MDNEQTENISICTVEGLFIKLFPHCRLPTSISSCSGGSLDIFKDSEGPVLKKGHKHSFAKLSFSSDLGFVSLYQIMQD